MAAAALIGRAGERLETLLRSSQRMVEDLYEMLMVFPQLAAQEVKREEWKM